MRVVSLLLGQIPNERQMTNDERNYPLWVELKSKLK
jgi:hypothetical protein